MNTYSLISLKCMNKIKYLVTINSVSSVNFKQLCKTMKVLCDRLVLFVLLRQFVALLFPTHKSIDKNMWLTILHSYILKPLNTVCY